MRRLPREAQTRGARRASERRRGGWAVGAGFREQESVVEPRGWAGFVAGARWKEAAAAALISSAGGVAVAAAAATVWRWGKSRRGRWTVDRVPVPGIGWGLPYRFRIGTGGISGSTIYKPVKSYIGTGLIPTCSSRSGPNSVSHSRRSSRYRLEG